MTNYFDDAKITFDTEIAALQTVRETLDENFDEVVEAILNTKGRSIFIETGEGVQELADALVRKVKEWNAK